MQYLIDTLAAPALLVHVASFLYVVGFLVRDQLVLRSLVLVATVLYIAYYYFAPDVPLWEAIAWSVVLGAANLWVMFGLLRDRTTFAMPEHERELFDLFGNLSPGEFRSLMAIARWQRLEHGVDVTRENEQLETLTYLVDGEAVVRKVAGLRRLHGGCFIGEVGFLLDQPASATVEVLGGARIVQWPTDELRRLCRRKPALRLSLDNLMNRDMARKVALS